MPLRYGWTDAGHPYADWIAAYFQPRAQCLAAMDRHSGLVTLDLQIHSSVAAVHIPAVLFDDKHWMHLLQSSQTYALLDPAYVVLALQELA